MSNTDLFAFVLMPFDPSFDDVYEIGIKEAAQQTGIRAERLDDQIFVEGMLDRIYRQIDAADIVVADMSGKNPNVFYEVGYAHAKDKLVILQTKHASDIPFDLKHRRHIVYGDSLSYLRSELTKNLDWAKSEIANIRDSSIRVDLKTSTGDLELSDQIARAHIDFRIDLFNESHKASPSITAIYLYSTDGSWKISQDGSPCPSTESDVKPFKKRYFLQSPVERLQGQSWAQLQFSGSRVLARAYMGDEIKDRYTISGKSLLRFVTSAGVFDYELAMNIDVDDLPF